MILVEIIPWRQIFKIISEEHTVTDGFIYNTEDLNSSFSFIQPTFEMFMNTWAFQIY